MMRRLLAALGFVMLLPATAAGQDPRLAARLDAATVGPVQALVDSARAAGLPAEPLVQKALEGESKGADRARIVAAVRLLYDGLRTAREQLGPEADDAELAAGASTLRAGATPRQLAELRSLRPDRSLVVPLGVLTDLVAHGVPVDEAWSSVERLARAGASDAQFVEMRQRTERNVHPDGSAGARPARPRGLPAPRS